MLQVDQATTAYVCPKECSDTQSITLAASYSQFNAVPDKYYTFNSSCRGIQSIITCDDPTCWIECGHCPYGQYASTPCSINIAQTCSPCVIPANSYLSPLVQDCSDWSQWATCSTCTSPQEYSDSAGVPFLNSCPAQVLLAFVYWYVMCERAHPAWQQANMGYTPDGACKPCVSCTGSPSLSPS